MKIQTNLAYQIVVVLLLFIPYAIVSVCNIGVVGIVIRALLFGLLFLLLTAISRGARPIRSKVLTVLTLFALRIIAYELVASFIGQLFAGGIFASIFTDALLIFFWVLVYLLLGGSWKRLQENGRSFRGIAISFLVCIPVTIILFLLFSPGSMISISVTTGALDLVQSLQMLSNVLAIKSVILEAVIVIVLLKANAKNIIAENDSTHID